MTIYKIEMEVRDSEIDIQGIVNNSNYYIYFQHARHKFLEEILKIDYIEMSKQNQHLLLVSSTIEFKKSLLPKQKFYITCKLSPQGKIRFAFEQEIRLIEDNSLIAKSINIGVCMNGNKNKPYVPEALKENFSS